MAAMVCFVCNSQNSLIIGKKVPVNPSFRSWYNTGNDGDDDNHTFTALYAKASELLKKESIRQH